jgi:hypothetical protein
MSNIISIPVPDPFLDKNIIDSIKEYVKNNPIPPAPDGGMIYFEEFAINGGPIEDKICENVRNKR